MSYEPPRQQPQHPYGPSTGAPPTQPQHGPPRGNGQRPPQRPSWVRRHPGWTATIIVGVLLVIGAAGELAPKPKDHRPAAAATTPPAVASSAPASPASHAAAKHPPVSAHAKMVAAAAAWMHGDGDLLYQQAIKDTRALDQALQSGSRSKVAAAANIVWLDASECLRVPPPVGRRPWIAAMRDWKRAAQALGGDPGAPAAGFSAATRDLRESDARLAAAARQARAANVPGWVAP